MAKNIVARGALLIGYSVSCGKCQSYINQLAILPLQQAKFIDSEPIKLGWKRSSRYGWLCDTCVKEAKKASEKIGQRKTVMFRAEFEL